jgi:hypothetical protein
MRIAAWNLEGRWTRSHREILDDLGADVWILTEVPASLDLIRGRLTTTRSLMSPGRHWSGVATVGRVAQVPAPADPHPASAVVDLGEVVVCASVLPWPLWRQGSTLTAPWAGTQSERMTSTVRSIAASLAGRPAVVWGGDWNTPLTGSLAGFDRAAQAAVLDAVDELGLQVATAGLPRSLPGCASIDHVAVPRDWTVSVARAVPVDRRLSDHWAYLVEARPPGRPGHVVTHTLPGA